MLAFAFIAALLIMLIKAFRNWTRQTSAVLQALKIGEAAREMRKETPCSVCGMTRLILPQIAEDFPEFSYSEFKARAETLLLSYFTAITQKQPERLSERSPGTAGTGAPGAHPPAGGWHTACLFGGPAASDRAG